MGKGVSKSHVYNVHTLGGKYIELVQMITVTVVGTFDKFEMINQGWMNFKWSC